MTLAAKADDHVQGTLGNAESGRELLLPLSRYGLQKRRLCSSYGFGGVAPERGTRWRRPLAAPILPLEFTIATAIS